jgi:transcriptional regulator with XRE-family HTH domain
VEVLKKQDSSMHADIGKRLRYNRERIVPRLTAEGLAERVGVTPRYIQDLERGKVGMSLTTLKNVARVLEISTDSLLFGEPAGIDALLRDADRDKIEQIEKLVRLQLEIMGK